MNLGDLWRFVFGIRANGCKRTILLLRRYDQCRLELMVSSITVGSDCASFLSCKVCIWAVCSGAGFMPSVTLLPPASRSILEVGKLPAASISFLTLTYSLVFFLISGLVAIINACFQSLRATGAAAMKRHTMDNLNNFKVALLLLLYVSNGQSRNSIFLLLYWDTDCIKEAWDIWQKCEEVFVCFFDGKSLLLYWLI